MNTTIQMEEEVFDAARRLTDEAERRAYLARAFADNPGLRARLERLLTVQASAEKMFSRCAPAVRPDADGLASLLANASAADAAGASLPADEQLGTRIGHYTLLQKIGEGGCGVVYMAEQAEPVRRRAALKVIKLGMDTKSVIARFEGERQALAMMDHPGIARVLDAGATQTGRPYFVMELVSGIKVTDFCDQNHLDTRQRLDLFIQICRAIQHAHQKGIIHRDIKPSNILVMMQDGIPMPKIIDFGIAKATEGRLTDKTVYTANEQLIGTPAYMSPEQAEMRMPDIDTRSDIYSLGVLLYELLTGRTPFDSKKLLECGLDEMRRTLREQEPQRPSTMLTTLQGGELKAVAEHRRAEPPKLVSFLRGDLDWIVIKALEKDRTRRYDTANGLAMDVERYLNNEPVIARPPSRRYRFQKLVRRNKVVFAAAAVVVASLVAGSGVCTWLFFKEREARRLADAAEQQQKRLRQEAEIRETITKGAFLLSQNRFAEADDLLRKIFPVQPSLEGAEVFRSVGEWNALQNHWHQAADRFGVLLHVNQFNGWDAASIDFLRCGAALAEAGDLAGFERFRKDALARFAATTNSVVADNIIKVALLLPGDERLMQALAPLADVALPGMPTGAGIPMPPGGAPFDNYGADTRTPELPLYPGQIVSIGARDSASLSNSRPGGDKIYSEQIYNRISGMFGSNSISSQTVSPIPMGAYSYDGMTVGVEYNEFLDARSATNPANYSITGTTVTNAVLGNDGKSVVLWPASQLSGRFAVMVSNVKDVEQHPVAPDSVIGGTVLNLQLKNFSTNQPLSASYAGRVATIVAGGADIWRTADQFGYAYTLVSGDFDYRLRVDSIGPKLNDFTRVGLMARDTLTNAGSREVVVVVNAGNTFQVLVRYVAGAEAISLPPNPLPPTAGSNLWVRLQRLGAVFHAFTSTNGVDWVQLYQFDSVSGAEGPFADPIYMGIAVCPRDLSASATAVVSDFGVTPTVPVEATIPLALVEYRRGNYAKAVEWCRRCLAHPEYNAARYATAQIILAMSCWQLHEPDQARSFLAQSKDMVGRKFESGLEMGGTGQGYWFDWIFARVLMREATLLIESSSQPVGAR